MKILNETKKCLAKCGCVTVGCLVPLVSFASSDDLSGVMSNVKSDFGTHSTFIHLVYGLEVIVGAYTYHKTKNFGALTGIVVLSLFVNYALGHWVFS